MKNDTSSEQILKFFQIKRSFSSHFVEIDLADIHLCRSPFDVIGCIALHRLSQSGTTDCIKFFFDMLTLIEIAIKRKLA